MTRALLPLSALRAFEAAARHLSFARAASELHVTPAAISHLVRTLEGNVGAKLFRRAQRRIFLTDAGQRLLPDLREGFDRLEAGYARLRGTDAARPLTVTLSRRPSPRNGCCRGSIVFARGIPTSTCASTRTCG